MGPSSESQPCMGRGLRSTGHRGSVTPRCQQPVWRTVPLPNYARHAWAPLSDLQCRNRLLRSPCGTAAVDGDEQLAYGSTAVVDAEPLGTASEMVRLVLLGVATIAACADRRQQEADYATGFEMGCDLGRQDAKRCLTVLDAMGQLGTASDSFSHGLYDGYHDCHRVSLVVQPCVQLNRDRQGAGAAPPAGASHGDSHPWVDSCSLQDVGVCIELIGYPFVDSWCAELRAFGSAEPKYLEAACPGDAVSVCDGVGVSLGHDVAPATLRFYRDATVDGHEGCVILGGELVDSPGSARD